MSTSAGALDRRDELSRLLRDLRRSSGLNGRDAAKGAGFGQPKLSKIENGTLLPTFDDADALCRALDATDELRDEVLDLLKALREETESARVILRRGAYRKQQQIAKVEADTVVHRAFDLGAVIGLLQTTDYMRQVFARRLSGRDLERAVAARVERQGVLGDEAKRFTLIMTEGALRWRAGTPEMMAAQMDHIADASRHPNVQVGVIPWSTRVHVFPGHEFSLYDERMAIVGIETATATIEDPRDVAVYTGLFAELEKLAEFDESSRDHLSRIAQKYRGMDI